MTTADRSELSQDQQPAPAAAPSCCGKAKTVALWTLVALNAVLVGVLVNRHVPENQARAAGAGNISAAELLAVPGNLPGYSNGVVFLLDSRSGMLSAISFDAPTQRMTSMAPIDIMKLVNNAGNVRGAGAGGARGKP